MSVDKVLLAHHEQQPLCTTRLPYRQGRKLTAVKVYTVNNESNHLLVFGVPSLNLRQEAKALFSRFGKLLQFSVSTEHQSEAFTETYHARYEKIPSARIAKRMLDTKNFYGGSLHVCYAPEFESVEETRQKILKRKQDVLFRLRNLEKDVPIKQNTVIQDLDAAMEYKGITKEPSKHTMNMGEVNTIIVSKKRKKIKPTAIVNEIESDEDASVNKDSFNDIVSNVSNDSSESRVSVTKAGMNYRVNANDEKDKPIEMVDLTSTAKEVVSNINEALNYNKFGNEVIRTVPPKPVNVIIFHVNNKKS